jgi:alpha-glucosidase
VEHPAGTASPLAGGWDFPALFKTGGGRAWALVTESAVDDRFAASHLDGAAPGGAYRVRLPDPAEGEGVGAAEPSSPLPWTLPWRVVIAGATPARIFESTLVDDLAPPAVLSDASWVKPGRASWSWWSDDDSPKSESALDAFTDFGAAMGWEYSLIDANWNLMDPVALDRIRAHAREKGVGLLLWYNSGGPHNVVTEQPRDRMHDRNVRRKEFATLRDWGIKGVKIDFWQSDKQDRIQQYLDTLRDAADFQLMVDFHGCTLPRGWERTFPHLMSMEAVPGAEQYKFNPKYPAAAAWHNTVLAFTRNVVGSMDYTPVTFSDSKYPHLTTSGHELALSVVFESGIQHYADSVKAYQALPADAIAFLKMLPAAWDDSRLLAGEPGTLVVVARRKGSDWYIGGISGTETPQTVTVDLSALGTTAGRVSTITDGAGPRDLLIGGLVKGTSGEGKLTVTLLPRGGFVARVSR